MANWREIREKFSVDQLLGLNLKLRKDATVYYSPINPVAEWDGWKLRAGQMTGKLFSWVSNIPANQNYPPLDVDGVFLMFYLQDDWSGNQHAYFLKLEPKMFDWEYTKSTIDDQRKANMNWYETLLDDFDTEATEYAQDVYDYVENALWVGGSLAAIILYWNLVGKYQVQARVYKGVVKDVIREVKA